MKILLLPAPRFSLVSGDELPFKEALNAFGEDLELAQSNIIFICGSFSDSRALDPHKFSSICEKMDEILTGFFYDSLEIGGLEANFVLQTRKVSKAVFAFDGQGCAALESFEAAGLINYLSSENHLKIEFVLKRGGKTLVVSSVSAEGYMTPNFESTAETTLETFFRKEGFSTEECAKMLIVTGVVQLKSLSLLESRLFSSLVISTLNVQSKPVLKTLREHLSTKKSPNTAILAFSVQFDPVLSQPSLFSLSNQNPKESMIPIRNYKELRTETLDSFNWAKTDRSEAAALNSHPTALKLLESFGKEENVKEFSLMLEKRLNLRKKKVSKVKKLEERKKKFGMLEGLVKTGKLEMALKKLNELMSDPVDLEKE